MNAPPVSARRLLALAVVALCAAAGATYSAAAPTAPEPAFAVSGFDAPVTDPPRPLDSDLSGGAGDLRAVRCAGGPTDERCWITIP